MPITATLTADASSGTNDGAAQVLNGATLPLGGATPKHAHLRFVTSGGTLVVADTVVSAVLTLTVNAVGAAPINLDLWASQFGAAIANADFNVSATNAGIADGNAAGFRINMKQILASSAIAGNTGTASIPGRFINRSASINAGFSDFEVRPGTGFVAGATATMTLEGPASATAAFKPTLVVTTLTDAELLAQNSYRQQAVGVDSYVAFAQETTPGTPVKGKVLLDARDSSLDSYAQNLRSQSLSKQRARPRKIAVGRSGAGGNVNFELTPEKWVQILPGILNKTSTTGSNPYVHTFKVATVAQVATFTFVEKVGNLRKVFPGAMIQQLSIKAALDAPIMGQVDVLARDEYSYDDNAAGATDEYVLSSTAGYDSVTNSILSFVGALVTIDTVPDRGLVQDCEIIFRQTVNERRGLSQKRGVTSHYPLGFEVQVNFNMYFENEIQLRKVLGVGHRDFPYRAEKTLQFQALQFDFAGEAGSTTQNISIQVPKMLFDTVRVPVTGEAAIMLSCTGVAVYDDISTLSNVVVVVTNSETSTVYAASTDTINVTPANP